MTLTATFLVHRMIIPLSNAKGPKLANLDYYDSEVRYGDPDGFIYVESCIKSMSTGKTQTNELSISWNVKE